MPLAWNAQGLSASNPLRRTATAWRRKRPCLSVCGGAKQSRGHQHLRNLSRHISRYRNRACSYFCRRGKLLRCGLVLRPVELTNQGDALEM